MNKITSNNDTMTHTQTQTQIEALAKAYADSFELRPSEYNRWLNYSERAERVLEWLLKDHLVVEKEKVRGLYHAKDRTYDTHSYDEYRRCECMGYMQAIEDIFPYLTIAEP